MLIALPVSRAFAAALVLTIAAGPSAAGELPVERLSAPPGFAIELYAAGLPDARSLALGEAGTVFVGTRRAGQVYALPDRDRDGRPDRVVRLLSGLNMPNGVALREGALYVAEVGRILRFDDIEARLDDPPKPVVVFDRLPSERHHGWKFIAFGPDGWLYVPVGAPCNVCAPPEPYATIARLAPDGSAFEVIARGVRNSVGFDWHPESGKLWFTDNGRDHLGDDEPPDELNRVDRPGLHFGFPYCHGGTLPDPEFGALAPCDSFVPPAQRLGPHVAALGLRFYDGSMFPPEYRGQIIIAEHGSWDRSAKIGYRLSLVRVEEDRALAYEPFVEGWLEGEENWGRPVDVLVMPDGALLVSDDQAGAVYRVSYDGP